MVMLRSIDMVTRISECVPDVLLKSGNFDIACSELLDLLDHFIIDTRRIESRVLNPLLLGLAKEVLKKAPTLAELEAKMVGRNELWSRQRLNVSRGSLLEVVPNKINSIRD